MENSFRSIYNDHNGRLIHKLDHYFEIYDRYFKNFRGREITILEIGISHGGSLQVWKKYFGGKAKIYAVDINPDCKKLEDDNVKIFIGSQEDKNFLASLTQQIPPPDIIIDDGGHTMLQQITSFEVLYNFLKNDGVYLCEDTCTSYWYEYGGGIRRKGTFIEYSKRLIDQLYAWHAKSPKIPVDDITLNTDSIHFHDSVVIFEKKRREPAKYVHRGEKTINHDEDPMASKRTLYHRIIKKLRSI